MLNPSAIAWDPDADQEYDPDMAAAESSHASPRDLLGPLSWDVFSVKPLLHSFARMLSLNPLLMTCLDLSPISLSSIILTQTMQIKMDA